MVSVFVFSTYLEPLFSWSTSILELPSLLVYNVSSDLLSCGIMPNGVISPKVYIFSKALGLIPQPITSESPPC